MCIRDSLKDLGLALTVAEEKELALPGADTAFTLYDMLDAIGGGRMGTQAITLLYLSLIHISRTSRARPPAPSPLWPSAVASSSLRCRSTPPRCRRCLLYTSSSLLEFMDGDQIAAYAGNLSGTLASAITVSYTHLRYILLAMLADNCKSGQKEASYSVWCDE